MKEKVQNTLDSIKDSFINFFQNMFIRIVELFDNFRDNYLEAVLLIFFSLILIALFFFSALLLLFLFFCWIVLAGIWGIIYFSIGFIYFGIKGIIVFTKELIYWD